MIIWYSRHFLFHGWFLCYPQIPVPAVICAIRCYQQPLCGGELEVGRRWARGGQVVGRWWARGGPAVNNFNVEVGLWWAFGGPVVGRRWAGCEPAAGRPISGPPLLKVCTFFSCVRGPAAQPGRPTSILCSVWPRHKSAVICHVTCKSAIVSHVTCNSQLISALMVLYTSTE